MRVGLLPTVRVVLDTIVRVGMLNYSLVGVQPLWQALCNSRCFQYHHVLHSDLHCATEIYFHVLSQTTRSLLMLVMVSVSNLD